MISLDSPGPPINVHTKNVTKNGVQLCWSPPEIDGGSQVHNYIIEKKESTRQAWNTVETACAKLSLRIEKLIEGAQYFFRVFAENGYGIGESGETTSVTRIMETPSSPKFIKVTYILFSQTIVSFFCFCYELLKLFKSISIISTSV